MTHDTYDVNLSTGTTVWGCHWAENHQLPNVKDHVLNSEFFFLILVAKILEIADLQIVAVVSDQQL